MTPTNTDNPKPKEIFFFVFHGRQRPLETLRGITVKPSLVFEARAYPSREYAMGETWEDAKNNLRDLIDREINNAKIGAEAWYRKKVDELSEEDRTDLYGCAFKVLTHREGFESITVGSTSGVVFEEIEGGATNTTQEESCSGTT
jgi:hypothetical protein